MKRTLAMLLALALLLTLPGAALAEADAAPAAPAVGDVVHGFEALEIREFPLINATITLFEHQKTGAKLMYIANDDTNRVFDLTFLTEAVDNTGLPHVFEHSTLDGSEKYPSKALFFNLGYQTYNTYMNALTYQWMTTYPIASLSEAQLLKYADYYTDSCLHPMVMEDESIFREEAWRYRLPDADAELTIEGTVYSEMLGATTLQRAAIQNADRLTFPGSNSNHDSGGSPDAIPDMTWEMVCDYHDRYYHPSNCIAYLYGEFEDYAAFLQLLDEAFSPYDKVEFVREDAGYQPLTAPVEQTFAFPVEAGSSTENASVIYYTIVCPGVDAQQRLVLKTLTDLLNSDASVLMQNLKKALPTGDFSCYIKTGSPDCGVQFCGENLNPDDAALFRQTIDESLPEIAENGFPQDLVDAEMASLSISVMLMREKSDVGVENVIPSLAYNYAFEGDVWGYLDYIDALGRMDEWNRQGLYAEAVSQWLIDSQTTALATTYPEPGLKEQNDAALAEKLAAVKAAMSEEEIAALVEASNAEDEPDDASGYVAQLQAVTVASLPEEIKEYEVRDEVDEAGVRHIDVPAGVDGVGQTALFLDAAGMPQEDLQWFSLFTELMGELDTAAHTREELAQLRERYLYDGTIYISLPREEDSYHPYLRMGWIALDEDLAAGYDLMREMVFDTRFDDAQRVLEQVQAIKASLKSSITNAPYNVQMDRAVARTDAMYRYYTYIHDLEYYAFLEQTEALLTEDPDAALERLRGVQAFLDNRAGAVAVYAGSEEGIAVNRPLADGFLAALTRDEPVEPVAYDLPIPAASEALVVDSSVQYNGLYADYETLGLEEYKGDLNAVSALVSDVFLYPQLRDQYGAYGVIHYAMTEDGVYIVSYRDPNIAQTFDVYDGLYDQVAAFEPDQATMDGYILSVYAEYATPDGELSGAVEAALTALTGEPQDQELTWMRELKAVTPDTLTRYAEMYRRLAEDGAQFTAGSASAINANAARYEVILNPFGAKDNTQVTLNDVPEDHPQYEAVRYAFESGYMAPVDEENFGVDEPATAGDLLTALYVMVGGTADTDEALAFFGEYGLAAPDTDPAAAITGVEASSLMSGLAGLMGLEWQDPDAQDAAMTRGDLAQALFDFETALSEMAA